MIDRRILAALLSCLSAPLAAQETPSHSVGADITFSSDADSTSIVRTGINTDWDYRNDETFTGFRLERTGYRPLGGDLTVERRVYLQAARPLKDWKASLSVGTDFHDLYGAASVHNGSRFRQEYFLERDKVETPKGVTRPIVYTFGGAAFDVPFSDRTQLTLVGGLQTFTGSNERVHLRANMIQVLKQDWGLSAQLRTRYFHNSVPNEFDYFSPRWFAEVLPVLQVRRYRGGWRMLAAAGYGAQRDNRSGWQQSRYANLRLSSPANRIGWALNAEATYTNQPISNLAEGYSYFRANLGVATHF